MRVESNFRKTSENANHGSTCHAKLMRKSFDKQYRRMQKSNINFPGWACPVLVVLALAQNI